ncbi:hypothetical protein C8J57DRAFT_1391446 [Mycena rebaudengoi]|nr:hypothetical protein C8J57DRAFT_1391446 [Mycena rebaudengoi]
MLRNSSTWCLKHFACAWPTAWPTAGLIDANAAVLSAKKWMLLTSACSRVNHSASCAAHARPAISVAYTSDFDPIDPALVILSSPW